MKLWNKDCFVTITLLIIFLLINFGIFLFCQLSFPLMGWCSLSDVTCRVEILLPVFPVHVLFVLFIYSLHFSYRISQNLSKPNKAAAAIWSSHSLTAGACSIRSRCCQEFNGEKIRERSWSTYHTCSEYRDNQRFVLRNFCIEYKSQWIS